MKQNNKMQILVFLIFLFMILSSFTQVISSKNIYFKDNQGLIPDDGQILFPPLYGYTTYLIDKTGSVNHTWTSSYTPGASAYWLGEGTILRTIRTVISGGGSGGGIQKVLWDGTIVWDFRYDTDGYLTHHDVKVLPNGNVLMIAWETKTIAQAIAAGRNPGNLPGNSFMPDHIIEVKPTGLTSGEIVWKWHAWDHLIQDFDPSKDNYGVVGDHPELIDINYGTFYMSTTDWLHSNSIDYHEEFDQILLSVHNFNEVWVIDHSTTTEEAAGHTGGNYGKGGDLLYRWGDPKAYDAGTTSDQKLFFHHGSSWVKPGYPGEGNILVFNNGNNRPSGQYSSVDEFTPPADSNGEYYLEPGSAYGPEDYTWSYTANPPTSFYANYCGDTLRLKDGNTLICDGVAGKFFEVTPEKNIVWQYINPYPSALWNDVFNIDYVLPEEPPVPDEPDLDCQGTLKWFYVKPGETVTGNFQVQNIGDDGSKLNWTINMSSITWGNWTFTPSYGENLTPEDGQVTVQVSVVAPNEIETEFQGILRVENKDNSSDFGLISVYLKTPLNKNVKHMPFFQFMLSFKDILSEHLYNLFEKFAYFETILN
ncbi:hypothetical protein AYK24_06425 [Thermoplasmatales archaeon SG8-52-4]|nr:MAG: hypothetical protein AYK24_06425 [Thermoplasmatales archaeon SG8-52-4]